MLTIAVTVWDINVMFDNYKVAVIYYLSMVLQSFCWTLTAFSVSQFYTQSVGLLKREISPRKAASYTQNNTNME
jgi:hypothetical protein